MPRLAFHGICVLTFVTLTGCGGGSSNIGDNSDVLTARLVETAHEGIAKDDLRLVARCVIAIAQTGDMTKDVSALFKEIVDKYGKEAIPHAIWFSEEGLPHPRSPRSEPVTMPDGSIEMHTVIREVPIELQDMRILINLAQEQLVYRGYANPRPQWCEKFKTYIYSQNGSHKYPGQIKGLSNDFVYYESEIETMRRKGIEAELEKLQQRPESNRPVGLGGNNFIRDENDAKPDGDGGDQKK